MILTHGHMSEPKDIIGKAEIAENFFGWTWEVILISALEAWSEALMVPHKDYSESCCVHSWRG